MRGFNIDDPKLNIINVCQDKAYLGDGITIGWDGWHYVLALNDGWGSNREIFLNPTVADRLLDFMVKDEPAIVPSAMAYATEDDKSFDWV